MNSNINYVWLCLELQILCWLQLGELNLSWQLSIIRSREALDLFSLYVLLKYRSFDLLWNIFSWIIPTSYIVSDKRIFVERNIYPEKYHMTCIGKMKNIICFVDNTIEILHGFEIPHQWINWQLRCSMKYAWGKLFSLAIHNEQVGTIPTAKQTRTAVLLYQ